MIARRLRVHGRVQGVGYRDAMRGAALAASVAGWVRNRRDGTVEAWVQGDEAAVAQVVLWSRKGPPFARVDHVDAENAAVDASLRGFDGLPTA
ncbi:MAG: acylphosphatase [Betaproteobacteria bacterium]